MSLFFSHSGSNLYDMYDKDKIAEKGLCIGLIYESLFLSIHDQTCIKFLSHDTQDLLVVSLGFRNNIAVCKTFKFFIISLLLSCLELFLADAQHVFISCVIIFPCTAVPSQYSAVCLTRLPLNVHCRIHMGFCDILQF